MSCPMLAPRENAIWRQFLYQIILTFKDDGLSHSFFLCCKGEHVLIKAFLRIPYSLSSALRRLYKTRGIRLKASSTDPPCCLAFMCEKSTDNSAGDVIWAIYGTQLHPVAFLSFVSQCSWEQLVSDPFSQQNLLSKEKIFLEI